MKICFLTNNLRQDNGAGVFSLRLIDGLKKELGAEPMIFTSEKNQKLWRQIFKIRRAIKQCDAVHALDGYPYGVIAYLASFGLGKKFIITAVGSGAIIHLYKWPHSFFLRRAYRATDKVIAISNFTAEEILKKVPNLAIDVINHGVDVEKFSNAPKTQIFQDLARRDGASRAIRQLASLELRRSGQANMRVFEKFGGKAQYLLSVGSLRWRKGYHRSIEAFAEVSKVLPDLKYVIVGKKYLDVYYNRLKSEVRNLKLEDKVIILDNVDNEADLIQLYKNAELFCLMSLTANRDFEGFGLVFLEAAAAGLPVVGTFGSGVEDAVLNGENGILVGPKEIGKFSEAIFKILQDKSLKEDFAKVSLEVAQNSTWDKRIEDYVKLYHKLEKPKIVYVTNARLPTEKAHGLATVKIAEAFADLGYEVDLIAPKRGSSKTLALQGHAYSPARFAEAPARRAGELLCSPRRSAQGLAKPASSKAPNQNGEVFQYYDLRRNFRIKKLPTLDLFGFIPERLAFWFQLFSFSIISLFYSFFKYRTWRLSRQVVFFSHDHVPLWFLSFIGGRIFYDIHHFPDNNIFYRRVLKKSVGLAVQTKWKVGELEKRFKADHKKIVYWPNGTDFEKFNIRETRTEARTKLNLSQDKKTVLYTGQLFDWKGIDTLIETAAELKNVDFYVVGGSKEEIKKLKSGNHLPKTQILHDLAQRDGASRAIPQQLDMRVYVKPGVEANVFFTGQRPHPEIPFWLRAADVLALPNTGKQKVSLYYTSPMKMFEYMASGTPIVASNIPSITALLNEKNAILAEADNPTSFSNKIQFFLENPVLAAKLGAEAQKDVEQYTWLERAKRISEHF